MKMWHSVNQTPIRDSKKLQQLQPEAIQKMPIDRYVYINIIKPITKDCHCLLELAASLETYKRIYVSRA